MTPETVQVKFVNDNVTISKCHEIRRKVFVKEIGIRQNVELNDDDKFATHLIAIINRSPAGTLCFRVIDNKTVKIDRLAVYRQYRRLGVGSSLVSTLEKYVKANKLPNKFELEATIDAVKFWEKLGWTSFRSKFHQEGVNVPIIWMKKYSDSNGFIG
ncbi:MAG: GNAT family N-acetyltransferase [Lentisphaerae bacterium]|nr:GNAT family N-acetyltransferase [Lentisphaerota bacterium]